ncbi:MAG TPA: hypothetical protein ENN90_15070 [Mariniphaga anaerophila]|uniref:Heavy-metal resistance n=1 Tax=Mariniphaga anaerophila TaxID=1484053 RepID=A0A831LNC9_9BACT|nr:hypothetical protein [Mariniphaga anaerophila]
MRRIILVSLFLSAFSMKIFGQGYGEKYSLEERAQMQTEWMKENLQLNDSQLLKIEALNLEYALKMEKIKGLDGNLSKLKAARKTSDEKDTKLKQLLNSEQFEFYQDKRKELRKKGMEMAKEQKKQGGLYHLTSNLKTYKS